MGGFSGRIEDCMWDDCPEASTRLRPARFRSLASKFSLFTGVVFFWVVATILGYDLRQHEFEVSKGIVLCAVVLLVAGAISRFTIRLLARPLDLLQAGIVSVQKGRLEPIRVSRTGDEIEFLGESFNKMIDALASSQTEIRRQNDLLEERIQQRTEELEQTMHRALAASQAKSEFLANISHELRTPMNGVIGMIDVVLDSRLTPDQREQLDTAQRCAYSLLTLLNDILDLSKIEAGKMVLEKVSFDVRLLVDDCVKAHLPRAFPKGVSITSQIGPEIPSLIIGDPLRIRQIMANLMSNAVKFTDQGSVHMSLSAEAIAGRMLELRLQVSDTGSGIDPSKLPMIFEKFTQADGSITRKYGGTGLGLAITKKLVDMHGGSMRVESALGKGSTFSATLLCELVDEYRPAPAAPARDPGVVQADAQAPGSVRVLVVEDNLVNQKVVTAILRKRRYAVTIANNGQEALDLLRAAEQPFSAVLMDVQMPVLDGLEATRAIRKDSRWEDLPILAMTAHAMNGDRERCLQAGMNGYISKPVHPAHLLTTLDNFLRKQIPPAQEDAFKEAAHVPEMLATERDLVASMLHLFLQLAPERLQRLRTAAHSEDCHALSVEARKVSTAADRICAGPVADWARRVDSAAQRADFEAALVCVDRMAAEIKSLLPGVSRVC